MPLYQDVRRRHLAGDSLNTIRRATDLAPATVLKYANSESFPERAVRGLRRSILDPFLPHLARRLGEGCEDAMALWRELQAVGYLHGPKMVQRWVAEAKTCDVGAVQTFATGLEADGAAIRAALTEAWSSGQAEGQVNRLKLLKRQSYGRASFDLLRRCVMMAA